MKAKYNSRLLYVILGIILYMMTILYALHFLFIKAEEGNTLNIFAHMAAACEHMALSPFEVVNPFTVPGGVSVLLLFNVVFAILAIHTFMVFLENESRRYIGIDLIKWHSRSDKPIRSAGIESDTAKTAFSKIKNRFKNEDSNDGDIILANGVRLPRRVGDNLHTLIIGSAGSGKTFGIVKPNIMQAASSMFIVDPMLECFASCYDLLKKEGYKVKVFSLSDMHHSVKYNPFDYLYEADGSISEYAVAVMVNIFMENASGMMGAKKKSGDPFWEKSAKSFLTAVVLYLLEFEPVPLRNFSRALKIVQECRVDEGADKSTFDDIIEKIRKTHPDALCLSSYDTFKLAPVRTANSIVISAAVDLQLFNQETVKDLTTTEYIVKEYDEDGKVKEFIRDVRGNLVRSDNNINFETLGEEKTALFLDLPYGDTIFTFLIRMMYSQIFWTLYSRAENIYKNKYLIEDLSGHPLVTMLKSEEDACELLSKLSRALIKRDKDINGVETFFIECSSADERFCIPAYICKGKHYIKQFSSSELARKFLDQVADNSKVRIKKGSIKLPWHVDFYLDEFGNYTIPNFPQILATMRKYEMSCMIVVQALSQLRELYDKSFETIRVNCRATAFLGTADLESCVYVSKLCGKTTVKLRHPGSLGFEVRERDLLSVDEVSKLPNDRCIVFINGSAPIYTTKYWASEHKRFNETGDGNPDLRVTIDIMPALASHKDVSDKYYCDLKAELEADLIAKDNENDKSKEALDIKYESGSYSESEQIARRLEKAVGNEIPNFIWNDTADVNNYPESTRYLLVRNMLTELDYAFKNYMDILPVLLQPEENQAQIIMQSRGCTYYEAFDTGRWLRFASDNLLKVGVDLSKIPNSVAYKAVIESNDDPWTKFKMIEPDDKARYGSMLDTKLTYLAEHAPSLSDINEDYSLSHITGILKQFIVDVYANELRFVKSYNPRLKEMLYRMNGISLKSSGKSNPLLNEIVSGEVEDGILCETEYKGIPYYDILDVLGYRLVRMDVRYIKGDVFLIELSITSEGRQLCEKVFGHIPDPIPERLEYLRKSALG